MKALCRMVCLASVLGTVLPGWAQGSVIWRCGNEYTNNPGHNPAARGCRQIHGGNVTVVEGVPPATRMNGTISAESGTTGARLSAARPANQRVDPERQRLRDAEARRILEQELRRAEERLAQARAEYADGQPLRLAHESADTPRYRARVKELRARVERAQADVAAIRRELRRLDKQR